MDDIISKRLYDRESLEYGKYKVIEYLGERGISKTPYYKVKFQNSSNEADYPLKTILENRVIDMEFKKKTTVKKNRVKKKIAKEAKVEYITLTDTRTLIIDAATISTGFSIFINKELKDFGYIYISSDKSITVRINYMLTKVKELIIQHNINSICIEDVVKGMNNDVVLYALSRLHGVLLNYFYEQSIPVIKVQPNIWKTYLNINRYDEGYSKNTREESKNKTLEVMKKEYGLDFKEIYKDIPKEQWDKKCYEDSCDATAIGYYYINNKIKV